MRTDPLSNPPPAEEILVRLPGDIRALPVAQAIHQLAQIEACSITLEHEAGRTVYTLRRLAPDLSAELPRGNVVALDAARRARPGHG